jgi:hypothetical protein
MWKKPNNENAVQVSDTTMMSKEIPLVTKENKK